MRILLFLFCILVSCNSSSLYNKILYSDNTLNAQENINIILYNPNSYCLGCNAVMQNIISSKKNLCVLSKTIRDIDKLKITNDFMLLGYKNNVIYNTNLYEKLVSFFTNYTSSGGFITISPSDSIVFSSSFKNPDFFNTYK